MGEKITERGHTSLSKSQRTVIQAVTTMVKATTHSAGDCSSRRLRIVVTPDARKPLSQNVVWAAVRAKCKKSQPAAAETADAISE
jgi:hypothetical protein